MDLTLAGPSVAALTGLVPPLATGLAAGLAVAMPLGAIGVLLLHEGMARGTRTALAGAAGVASVDAVYATVAVLAGAGVSTALAGRETAIRLVGAVVLGTIAVRGLLGALRGPRLTATFAGVESAGDGPAPEAVTVGTALDVTGSLDGTGSLDETGSLDGTGRAPDRSRPLRVYGRFVGLTAINPLTATAFAVLAAGLAQRWSSSADRWAFVVGVAAASLAWQAVLAVTGGLLGARVRARSDDRMRRALGVGGFGLVAVLAVVLAVG
jgi:arginine exporter protein ArgO